MNQPPNTKKGAIPLDQRTQPVQGEQANGQPVPVNAEDPWVALVEQMGLTLAYLYNETKAGRVKALSCVFVDDSGVPQHAYFVAPNAAVPLLAGMMVGTDDVRIGASKSMEGYKNWLRQQAEAQAKSREPSNASGAGQAEASKPN